MTTINEKTTIPVKIAISFIVMIAGFIFEAGISWSRYNALEEEFRAHKSEHVAMDRQQHEQELKLQRLEIFMGSVDKKLESIEKKLDRLENK